MAAPAVRRIVPADVLAGVAGVGGIALVAATIVLTSAGPSGPAGPTVGPPTAPAPTPSTSLADDAGPTTIAAALGTAIGPGSRRLDARRAEAVEALIETCMAAAGFTYHASPSDPPPAPPDADLDPASWAARWGFGITTLVPASGDAGTTPGPSSGLTAGDAPAPDPRYTAALLGTDRAPGCQTTATTEVYGLPEHVLAPLRADLDALDRTIAHDPRVDAATLAWRVCLRAAGIDADDRPSVVPRLVSTLQARFEAVVQAQDAGAMEALRAEERRDAVAVAACEARYATGASGARAEAERAFVRDHRVVLDTMRRELEAAQASWPTLPPWPP